MYVYTCILVPVCVCCEQSLMIASELEDHLGEGVVHSNMATTYEMLFNLEETLIHQEKVSVGSVSTGLKLGYIEGQPGLADTVLTCL